MKILISFCSDLSILLLLLFLGTEAKDVKLRGVVLMVSAFEMTFQRNHKFFFSNLNKR
jgi:hypothetical protein